MLSDGDFYKDMWVGPDIWVPPRVADFLISRMQWIREGGEHADFQVGAPPGFDYGDLTTLAYLIVTNDLVAAKVLADNLPRSQMWMEPSSSSLVEENANYTLKNPFKRRRGRQRKQGETSGFMEKDPLSSDGLPMQDPTAGDGKAKQGLLSDDDKDSSIDVDDGTFDGGDSSEEADDGDDSKDVAEGNNGNSIKGTGVGSSHVGNSSDPAAKPPGGGVPKQDLPGKEGNANPDLLHGHGGDLSKDVDERTSDDENISKDNGDSDDDGSKDADDNDVSKGDGVSGAGGKSERKRVHKSKTTKTKRKEQFSRIIIPTLDRSAKV